MIAITFFCLQACVFDKGKTDIVIAASEDDSAIQVTSVEVSNDQLILGGSNLNRVTAVRVTGSSFDHTFTINSQVSSQLIALAQSAISFIAGSSYNLICSDAHGQTTYSITFTLPDKSVTAVKLADMGAADGEILRYDATGQVWEVVPLNINGVSYKGVWNANTNSPDLTDPVGLGLTAGDYYVVSVNGTTNLDGNNSWQIGDWAIYNGTAWQEIDNTSMVTSVFGRQGAVTAQSNDYTWAQIDKTTSSISDVADVDTSTPPTDGQVLKWDNTNSKWIPGDDNEGGGGSVTAVTAASPLASSGGTTPEISITGRVAASNLPTGTSGLPLVGQGAGDPAYTALDISGSGATGTLPLTRGGTGATSAGAALTALGAQASDSDLDDLADGVLSASKVEYGDYFIDSVGTSGQVWKSDGSGRGVWGSDSASDNLGDHTATKNITLGSHWLSGDGDNEGITVDTSGNVGIGSSTPQAKLDVNGTIRATEVCDENGNNCRDVSAIIDGSAQGQGPAFSAHKVGGDQTVSSGSYVKITWDSEAFDTHNDFNLTNDRFQPSVSGKYLLTGHAMILNVDNGVGASLAIYKNGSELHIGSHVRMGNGGNNTTVISTVVDADGVNDYFELYVWHNHGSDRDVAGTSLRATYFQGSRIGGGISRETTRTINLDNSMTAAQIQSAIDAVGKYIPPDVTVTFQFADGTYTLDNTLTWEGFYGGGRIDVLGNTSETNATELHTTQQVFLNFSSNDVHGIMVKNCKLGGFKISNFKIAIKTNTNYMYGIYNQNSSVVYVYYSYIYGNSTSYGGGVVATFDAYLWLYKNYFSNVGYAIYNNGGEIMSNTNDDTGTMPRQGMRAQRNGCIIKYMGSQPSGSTHNEEADYGGCIR